MTKGCRPSSPDEHSTFWQTCVWLPSRMLSRYETYWQNVETLIDSEWDWEKITQYWQLLIQLDRKFFPGRFRPHISEAFSTLRYIPSFALVVLINYCRQQPPNIQTAYYRQWKEKLETENWSDPHQKAVVQWHLQQWEPYIRQFLSPDSSPLPR
jgi:hypothetical protein